MKHDPERLKIAKAAYADIKRAMDLHEANKDFDVHCCWDECISVDDEFFSYLDLRDNDQLPSKTECF